VDDDGLDGGDRHDDDTVLHAAIDRGGAATDRGFAAMSRGAVP
jgi:hypothetical protein